MPEEFAAAIAAVTSYLEYEAATESESGEISRWLRAGRLESHGLPVTPANLTRPWGS